MRASGVRIDPIKRAEPKFAYAVEETWTGAYIVHFRIVGIGFAQTAAFQTGMARLEREGARRKVARRRLRTMSEGRWKRRVGPRSWHSMMDAYLLDRVCNSATQSLYLAVRAE